MRFGQAQIPASRALTVNYDTERPFECRIALQFSVKVRTFGDNISAAMSADESLPFQYVRQISQESAVAPKLHGIFSAKVQDTAKHM